MATYRAAIFSNLPFTDRAQSHLPEDQLIEAAMDEARRANILGSSEPRVTEEEFRDGLYVGEWKDGSWMEYDQEDDDEVEPDEAFESCDRVHVAQVELTVEEAFVLGMRRSVELRVTPARLVLSYRQQDGRAGTLAWEPAEPEAQALAYRQALTHPRDEALDLAWQAKRRDEAEALAD